MTKAYKALLDKASTAKSSLGSFGSFGSSLGIQNFDINSLNVDDYVTTKALDGLFKMVADEEKHIRQNPMARTTDMMQKVFGALKQ